MSVDLSAQSSSPRFAAYLRLSTTDKQDSALSFPSQLKACEQKAAELGGWVVCSFEDRESGAKQERPGWAALAHEARDRTTRRFDAVVVYSTSRLARDRLAATLFERNLRKVGVAIHYATGAGDPTTPEGGLFIGMQQLWDEFERNKLARETKRGMRELSEQGFRAGGRPPYGYRAKREAPPEDHRDQRDKRRVTLEPDLDQAAVVALIFDAYTNRRLSLKGIAEMLNHPGGPPPPSHVYERQVRRNWAVSTIRSILANPVYTGRLVWNRLDCASARQSGGAPRLRDESDWIVVEDAHPPLVTNAQYAAAQDRLASRERGPRSRNRRTYLFAGRVRCCTGHDPLSMQGKARKGHRYYACSYGATASPAALDAHTGRKWLYVREDLVLGHVESFLTERLFGPMRIERLEQELHPQRPPDPLTKLLARLPDLTQAFQDAAFEVKRHTLDAFDVQVAIDKAKRRVEISASISESVVTALENEKALREEGLQVTVTDIAGAGCGHLSATGWRITEVRELP